MAISFSGITIDCTNPRQLAEFWKAVTGFVIKTDFEGEYLFLLPEDQELGEGVYLALQRVAEPKVGKNRTHPDFHVDDRAAEVARLHGLGASVIAEHEVPGFWWTVLTDPEGNEFCVGSASG